jgi:protoporphyrinogen/coproporphyrinogen III oxidase
MRVAIIGGGVAGLAAAYELEKNSISYTLFEASPRLGGVISSEIVDGAVLELGPDSFLTEKPQAADLCRELGLADQLVGSNDEARKTFIVVKNRLIPMPDGLMFLIPTRLIPTALTRLFSWGTKIRMGLELLHPPRKTDGTDYQDESVADLVRRHYGPEAVDRLADPLLSGIYGGDSSQLSAQTVLPKLVEMEQEYGSLTRGMLAGHRKMRAAMKKRATEAAAASSQSSSSQSSSTSAVAPVAKSNTAPRTIFTTLKGGMRQLTEALTARLNPTSIRLNAPVTALEPVGDGWLVKTGEGEATQQQFDAVIVATQAWAAGRMLEKVDPELAADLTGIAYSSSVTVNLVYNDAEINLPEGFGFLVPASEGRAMLACTFVHRKFLGRTPAGKAILRAFLGGMRGEAMLAETDATLIQTVRRELKEILSLTAAPITTRVTRWRRSMAQYAVGHNDRKARITDHVSKLNGLYLAGNAYDGIGISDCIRLGRKAASEIARH